MGVHGYVLITILMFIFPKFLSLMLFGQIWSIIWISSNWLKFLRQINCYAYYSFNVYFFKNYFHSYFLGKFDLKVWSSSNWLKFGTEAVIDCYMLISILMFIFSKFLSFIFFRQIWSQNLKFSKETDIWYSGTLLHAYHNFNFKFFKILPFL